jgi:hypothetical protein
MKKKKCRSWKIGGKILEKAVAIAFLSILIAAMLLATPINEGTAIELPDIPPVLYARYYIDYDVVGAGVFSYNSSTTGPFESGTILEIAAYPNSGWEFTGWGGDLSGTDNPLLLVMDSNKTFTVTFVQFQKTIKSCNSSGTTKDNFAIDNQVYASGSHYQPSTTYDIYVVEDVTWVNSMTIPQRVPNTATKITSDGSGNIQATILWGNPLIAGKYDIVIDVDGDGLFSAGVDALDDSDIEVTAGFSVIPEMSLGTITTAIIMSAVLIGFKLFRPKLQLNR